MGVRKNTVVVDFGVLSSKPDTAKMHKFIMDTMKLKLSDANHIQYHNIDRRVYIEMVSYEVVCQYDKEHDCKHYFVCDGATFLIHVHINTEAVIVRIHDLPSSMPNTTVRTHMLQYRDVYNVTRERWKHYFPGSTHFENKTEAPNLVIYFDRERKDTVHSGQKLTCKYCDKDAHPNQRCKETNISTSGAVAKTPQIQSSVYFPPLNEQSAPPSPDVFREIITRARRSLAKEETRANNNDQHPPDDNTSTPSMDTIDTILLISAIK